MFLWCTKCNVLKCDTNPFLFVDTLDILISIAAVYTPGINSLCCLCPWATPVLQSVVCTIVPIFLPLKLAVERKLVLKNKQSPLIFEHTTAALLNPDFLAFFKAQALHTENVPLSFRPKVFLKCRICPSKGDLAHYVGHSCHVFFSTSSPYFPIIFLFTKELYSSHTAIPFFASLINLLPSKKFQVKENKFVPALAQYLMGHWVCIFSLTQPCQTIAGIVHFFMAFILPELPCTDSSFFSTSNIPVSSLVM